MRSRQASAASPFQFVALQTLFMAMSSPLHAQVFEYADHYAGYNSEVIRYQDAGVSIDEADRAVSSIKKMARQSFTRGVLTDIGSFGACYALSGWKKPVLMISRRCGTPSFR